MGNIFEHTSVSSVGKCSFTSVFSIAPPTVYRAGSPVKRITGFLLSLGGSNETIL
jgi:hypothetical protein